jgi:hypothetical protein
VSIAHQPAMQPVAATTRLQGTLYPTFPHRRGVALAKLAGLMAVSAMGIALGGAILLGAMILFVSSIFS